MKQTEYDWVYLFGAVCPSTGQSSGMIAGSVGIAWMNLHLRWISEEAAQGPGGGLVHVVLILDQAGWHTSPKLRVPQNITLLPLEVSALTGNAGTNPRSPDKTGVNRC